MKKNIIIIYAVIAVAAGILTGMLISSIIWKDKNPNLISDIFPDIDNIDDIDQNYFPIEDEDDNRKVVAADYNITNKQRYYDSLATKKSKNVLLVGESDFGGNFDTIIIATISENDKTIRLINFPRDIYIDYSDEVLEKLKEKSPKLYEAKGFQKINAAHLVGRRIEYEKNSGRFGDSSIDFLADLIEEVFQIPIDDYAYGNTKAFRDVVDLFDGIDIKVPLRMKYEDPLQNLYIDLYPGMQHLNGEQAEGFVRFRQGYDDNGELKNYSDIFRKENQNEFLKAFFKQHITIKNLGKIDDLAELMGKNIRTSINSVKEIAAYVNLLRKAVVGKYTNDSIIVECTNPKNIKGVYFDIIRSK
jgi:LCP family protein required for cell wall assembly